MYSAEFLSRFSFFTDYLKGSDASPLLDSLTGVLSRGVMIRYIRYLVECETPFTLAILDLDNFKSVNDTYGHRAGDTVLARVSEDLCSYVGEKGVVGRFGGDEFLIVNLRDFEYDSVHAFYDGMYGPESVFRRLMNVGGADIFVTATIGSATYPKNACDFDGLFAKIDKTLYRGKAKGRNCYIIYVDEKHAKLEISTLAKQSLYDTLHSMAENFDGACDFSLKIQRGFAPAAENLRLNKAYYVNCRNELVDPLSGVAVAAGIELEEKLKGDLFAPARLDALRGTMPNLYTALCRFRYETVLISRIALGGTDFGFLIVCPEPQSKRMWQDDECAAVFFFARLIAAHLADHGLLLE